MWTMYSYNSVNPEISVVKYLIVDKVLILLKPCT